MGGKGLRPRSKVVWPGFSGHDPRHVKKVGRNEPCPCGSSKKYKDCHESEGGAFLARLERQEWKRLRRERRAELKAAGVPWYRRIFV